MNSDLQTPSTKDTDSDTNSIPLSTDTEKKVFRPAPAPQDKIQQNKTETNAVDRERYKDDIFKTDQNHELSADNLTAPYIKPKPIEIPAVEKPKDEVKPQPVITHYDQKKEEETKTNNDEFGVELVATDKEVTSKDDSSVSNIEAADFGHQKDPVDPNTILPQPEPEAVPINQKPTDDDERILPNYRTPLPPIKQKTNNGRSVMIITAVSIVLIIIGFGAGYFSYGHIPNIFNGNVISADITNPVESIKDDNQSVNNTTSTSEPSSTTKWPIYSNTKYLYSIQYPDNWYSNGADNLESSNVQFTSYKPSDSGSGDLNGYKIDILFQDSNDKELKPWIESNNTITNTKNVPLKELKINNTVAYQQTTDQNGKSTTTYILRNDKVMLISFYAPQDKYDDGLSIYQKMLDSIILM